MKKLLFFALIVQSGLALAAERWPEGHRQSTMNGCLLGMVSHYMALLKKQGLISDADGKDKIEETRAKVEKSFAGPCECVLEKYEKKYSIDQIDELKKDRAYVLQSVRACAAASHGDGNPVKRAQ